MARYSAPRRIRILIVLICGSILLGLLIGEMMSRFLMASERNIPLFFAVEQYIYPPLYAELKDYSPGNINILLLGGSTLNFLAEPLKKQLPQKSGKIRFYNLAYPAHTSQDSINKLRYLVSEGYHFDYIIFYHGINEVRTNNAPGGLFARHYEHYLFYRLVNPFFKKEKSLLYMASRLSLFYRLYTYYITYRCSDLIDKDIVIAKWIKYGHEIKSSDTFRANLAEVITIADSQRSSLIVPTFAFNLPHNYSLDVFKAKKLGYADVDTFCYPTEIWGSPDNVVKGIEVHNAIIRSLSSRFVFINTDNISKNITNFYDICHLSGDGEKALASLIMNKIISHAIAP